MFPKHARIPLVLVVATLTTAGLIRGGSLMAAEKTTDKPTVGGDAATHSKKSEKKQELATFAGGCFWCIEAVFDELAGVESVESGYAGGQKRNPTYEEVCTGLTGHAEVIQIAFDPDVISYADLLAVFFTVHDPTTLNRQGPDVGPQYRSAIFYHSDEQKKTAEEMIARIDAKRAFDAPIVTEVAEFTKFYPAEDYHQEYFANNPNNAYCRINTTPKLKKLRHAFRDLLKSSQPKGKDGEASASATNNHDDEHDEAAVDWRKVDWRKKLSPEQFRVARQAGTEPPFQNEFFDNHADGTYSCICCGTPLFTSDGKFDSGCGWPSFFKAIEDNRIRELVDRSHGMVRTEIRCAKCDAHLGHVFDDGPAPTGIRYCMNSASMKFKDAETGEETEGGR